MSAAGVPGPFASREEVRTALVGVSQVLGDKAMDGSAIGTVLLVQNLDGSVTVNYTGITAPHAIGMLQLGLNMVVSGAMGGKPA